MPGFDWSHRAENARPTLPAGQFVFESDRSEREVSGCFAGWCRSRWRRGGWLYSPTAQASRSVLPGRRVGMGATSSAARAADFVGGCRGADQQLVVVHLKPVAIAADGIVDGLMPGGGMDR
jgi:hypothetical protein